MRILLVHRYFYPDVAPYAQMLRVLAARYTEDGHEVAVFTSQPSYNDVSGVEPQPMQEVFEGFSVFRVSLLRERKKQFWRRAINAVLFPIALIFHCMRAPAYDIITVTTMPPVVMGAAARFITWIRGGKYLYHCQDLYPETGIISGVLRKGFHSRLLMAVDRRNCRRASAVVVLSTDMQDTLRRRGLSGGNVRVLNNFAIDRLDESTPLPAGMEKPSGIYRVLFAGNLGRFQGLDTLISAAWLLKNRRDIQFMLMGTGVAVEDLQSQAGDLLDDTIVFIPHQPLPIALRIMHDADLGVISLVPGIIRSAYPSKTMMYLEAGCRVLAVVEPESELSRFVVERKVGSACKPGNAEELARRIVQECERSPGSEGDTEHIRQVSEECFGIPSTLAKWSALLREVHSASDDVTSCSSFKSH